MGLRRKDVFPPRPHIGQAYRHCVLQLCPSAGMDPFPSKSGEFDDSVVLDSRSRPVAPLALQLLYKDTKVDTERLVKATLAEYERLVHEAAEQTGLSALDIVPHMFRHGGASHDVASSSRSLTAVQTNTQTLQKKRALGTRYRRQLKYVGCIG